MKPRIIAACLALAAGPAIAQTWTCRVPYDEVNGGGTATITPEHLVFASNWPHRAEEVQKCTRTGVTSECMSAELRPTRAGGAVVIAKMSTIAWQEGGAPMSITTRQPTALFGAAENGFPLIEAFPATAYTFALTACVQE